MTDLSMAPTEVALTYRGHLALVLVGLRRELNDSFDSSGISSAGEAEADTGGGTRMVVAGGPCSPHWESCRPPPEHLHFVAAHISLPLNFLCDHSV